MFNKIQGKIQMDGHKNFQRGHHSTILIPITQRSDIKSFIGGGICISTIIGKLSTIPVQKLVQRG